VFRVKDGLEFRRSQHLADVCAQFVREVQLEFDTEKPASVKETLRILNILGQNLNIEKLLLKANSCQAEWPENGEEFPR